MITKIILGTVQFGLNYGINNTTGKPSEETVSDILNQAYLSGIRKLDTAEAYGNAQTVIGNFHRKNRTSFDVNTKFKSGAQSKLKSGLLSTLEELHIDRVNTWFYHSFQDYIESPDWLTEIAKIKEDGLIEKIGVSVYSNFELDSVIGDDVVDVIQLPFNLLDNRSQRGDLLEKAKAANKTIQIRSAFLQGLFFMDISSLPINLQSLKPYLERLLKLSREYDITMESLCLQYVNAQPHIDEIIIGVDSKMHLLKNLEVLKSELDPEVCHIIDSIQVSEPELLYPFNWK